MWYVIFKYAGCTWYTEKYTTSEDNRTHWLTQSDNAHFEHVHVSLFYHLYIVHFILNKQISNDIIVTPQKLIYYFTINCYSMRWKQKETKVNGLNIAVPSHIQRGTRFKKSQSYCHQGTATHVRIKGAQGKDKTKEMYETRKKYYKVVDQMISIL